MEQLLQLLTQYAKMIDASDFDCQFNYSEEPCINGSYSLKEIYVYFKQIDGKIQDSFPFESEGKAIEGMKGLIQFKQNLRA